MSFWKKWFESDPPPAPSERPAQQEPEPGRTRPADPSPLARLARGERADESEALAQLRAARGSSNERRALEWVIAAQVRGPVSEPLLVGAAETLVERGQPEDALRLLGEVDSSHGLLLAADIRADRGELSSALALAERVLARDIDAPGARERHQRWAGRLRGAVSEVAEYDGATVIRHAAPVTGLRIVGEAGRGGAGTVYEAIDERLGRRVAFKTYHRPAEERRKLEREARLAVKMVGPGVVRLYDANPEQGYLIMEWVAGGALKRVIRQGDTNWLWPLRQWFVPLVRAVARVHQEGLVHADLKPANVLLRTPEEPVVSDFGSARPAGDPDFSGTVGYLSPERLDGEPLSKSDDVYALGRILEDALCALGPDAVRAEPWWRRTVRQATASAATRPTDAVALARLLSLDVER